MLINGPDVFNVHYTQQILSKVPRLNSPDITGNRLLSGVHHGSSIIRGFWEEWTAASWAYLMLYFRMGLRDLLGQLSFD